MFKKSLAGDDKKKANCTFLHKNVLIYFSFVSILYS